MSNWTQSSLRVSEFVDRFLDRALGATNDPSQRVPVYDPLPNKFYLGKLLPTGISSGGGEYKAKVGPCSYIATFLIKGKLPLIKLRVVPSFNLYFCSGIHKREENSRDANADWLNFYSAQADPSLPATSGRDDMWVGWRERIKSVPDTFIQMRAGLQAPKDMQGKLHGIYDPTATIDAYIRKRADYTKVCPQPTESLATWNRLACRAIRATKTTEFHW